MFQIPQAVPLLLASWLFSQRRRFQFSMHHLRTPCTRAPCSFRIHENTLHVNTFQNEQGTRCAGRNGGCWVVSWPNSRHSQLSGVRRSVQTQAVTSRNHRAFSWGVRLRLCTTMLSTMSPVRVAGARGPAVCLCIRSSPVWGHAWLAGQCLVSRAMPGKQGNDRSGQARKELHNRQSTALPGIGRISSTRAMQPTSALRAHRC